MKVCERNAQVDGVRIGGGLDSVRLENGVLTTLRESLLERRWKLAGLKGSQGKIHTRDKTLERR